MDIKKNDKFVATKNTFFLDKGEVVDVTSVNKYGVWFTYGNGNEAFMDFNTFENHFERVVEKKVEKVNPVSITEEHIKSIIDNSEFKTFTVFDKCTVVVCKLPNGFVITESSACVSPENYDMETGKIICLNKIVDKVWELEGYKLQDKVGDISHKAKKKSAENKPVTEDNCTDTDLDCYDCEDYTCRWNPSRHLNIT